MRIPGIKNKEKLDNGKGAGIRTEAGHENVDGDKFRFSSRRSRWLDEEGLRSRGMGKKPIGRDKRGSAPSLLVRLAGGVVITASKEEGLKAWELKGRELITACGLAEGVTPTCLAVDEQDGEKGRLGIVIGFEDGSWGTWELDVGERSSVRKYRHPPSSNGMLSAVAYAHPYILSITEGQLLSFYTLNPVGSIQDSDDDDTKVNIQEKESQPRPYLLTSLKSHSSWPPLSLSIRLTPATIIASIAYTLPTYLSGYTISIQELHFATSPLSTSSPPTLITSRLTTSFPSGFHPLTSSAPVSTPLPRPITLSYAHPYILATHPDNTLSLYLCTSTHTSLSLSPPQKLFGHTSSISFASITSRGKAVSVSERGGELRVWELEPRIFKGKGDGGGEERSVRVLGEGKRHEEVAAGEVDRKCNDSGSREENRDKGKKLWVGFDEEMAIVLKSSTEDSGCECEDADDGNDHEADDRVAIGRASYFDNAMCTELRIKTVSYLYLSPTQSIRYKINQHVRVKGHVMPCSLNQPTQSNTMPFHAMYSHPINSHPVHSVPI
ncbi:hypothetical protein EYC84_008228 [Monilinia fructicola]|uniref:Uncharacterized protein n=1 Tax=Monilinia fructicola TaxID=38448 RepID=A0A5M9JEN6_MONFR|nr:hypothetical protein EYC84_008228 [Monilinia fructicola]